MQLFPNIHLTEIPCSVSPIISNVLHLKLCINETIDCFSYSLHITVHVAEFKQVTQTFPELLTAFL